MNMLSIAYCIVLNWNFQRNLAIVTLTPIAGCTGKLFSHPLNALVNYYPLFPEWNEWMHSNALFEFLSIEKVYISYCVLQLLFITINISAVMEASLAVHFPVTPVSTTALVISQFDGVYHYAWLSFSNVFSCNYYLLVVTIILCFKFFKKQYGVIFCWHT